MEKSIINFRTQSQAALFNNELQGQISDGKWENSSPHNHWEFWANCTAVSNTAFPLGVIINRNAGYCHVRKNNYNFASTDLIEIVGTRMIAYAKLSMLKTYNNLSATVRQDVGYYMNAVFEQIIENNIKSVDELNVKLEKYYNTADYKKAKNLITQEMLDEFWSIKYVEKELKQDLKEMKKTIKAIHKFRYTIKKTKM